MSTVSRSFAAAALALTMAVTTVSAPGIAQAQSSVGSSSTAPSVQTSETRLLKAGRDYLNRSGHRQTAEAQRDADRILAETLAGDHSFFDNTATVTLPNFKGMGFVYRIPNALVDEMIRTIEAAPAQPGRPVQVGVAVASDEDYHYLAEVIFFY